MSDDRQYGFNDYHPNVQQIAGVYRWRPFRRIRNLLDHLDTVYRLADELDRERQRAVMQIQRCVLCKQADLDRVTGRTND